MSEGPTADGAVDAAPERRRATWPVRVGQAVAVGGLAVVAWALATAWGAVVHGHPAYAVLLVLTVLGCVAALWRSRRPTTARGRARRVLGVVLTVAAIGWIGAIAWLRPFVAVEPALEATGSDDVVTVTQTPTRVELTPVGESSGTAVLFQPGAKVEARAYAAVLRPLAEAGHTVVIVKQPLSIGFLATGALDAARADLPAVERWVVGGHSLGGVVAAMEADAADTDATAPAVGLLLYASYPAGDVGDTLTAAVESVSGTEDGLSTPEAIEASRADLPAGSSFTVVDGAVHAFFGDYGPQPGDGTPTISHDDARQQISAASRAFVDGLSG
ncbi:alpha/beta hydrolase [Isoptericola sp. AK164]|uniref:alpha/beta hydrolase n=1 Tax=Isoptericola sp. AK164 TaxID=3024246 RepID=UPI0024186335|nr:alpha/beta hydrolase [Isoptericola sp. AK164]